jgi:hypothetical protein
MNFPAVPQIDIAEGERASPGIGGPQIVWPTMLLGERGYEEGDVKRFPDNEEYHARRKLGIGGAMSTEFRSAIRQARDRIWVLDDYLFANDKSAERLIDVLFDTAATDIKLATSDKIGAKEWALYLKSLEPDFQRRNPATRIQVSLDLRKMEQRDMIDVHDRFAVIDDVLWHCGATIGGLHDAINAMTFGWSVRETKAVEFFDRLWKILERTDVC